MQLRYYFLSIYFTIGFIIPIIEGYASRWLIGNSNIEGQGFPIHKSLNEKRYTKDFKFFDYEIEWGIALWNIVNMPR